MHPLTSGIRLDKCFRVKTKEPGLLCEYKKFILAVFFYPNTEQVGNSENFFS